MEVVKAIVEGDHYTLGGKTALTKHPHGIIEQQNFIVAPGQNFEPAAEKPGSDEQRIPPVLILY